MISIYSLVWTALIGLAAGWLGSYVLKGSGQGLQRNLIFGIIGSFIGHTLFRFVGLSFIAHAAGPLITATIGAIATIWVADKFLN